MSGPDTDEFHAVVAEQIEENRRSIDRLSEENRLLRDAIGRLLGKGPPRDDPDDELAARRRKYPNGRRHAGFIALPIALGGLIARALLHARTATPLARIAWAAGAAVTAGAIVGGTAYVVTHAPEHHIRRDSSVTSPAPSPSHHAPGRKRLLTPIPRRGQGKGAAARSSTLRQLTPPAAGPRSRAAAPQVSPVTVPDVTQGVTPPAATPTVLPATVPPLPTPTATIPTPLPSVTKATGHLVCHLNLLGIRVCVKG